MQVIGLQPQVLAPPVGAGHGSPGSAVIGGSKVLSTETRDVDPPDRQADGVTTQMVGERFDFG